MVESFRSAEGCAAPGRADERWPGFDARNLVLRRNVPTSVGQIQAAVHPKHYHRRRNQQTNGLCGGRRRRRRQDAELLREHSRPLSALADLLERSTAVVHAAGVELPTIHVPLETSDDAKKPLEGRRPEHPTCAARAVHTLASHCPQSCNSDYSTDEIA